MKLELKLGYNYKEEVKDLFNEYTNMIIKNNSKFKEYLKLQNYDDEINNLENKYGLPYGRLYVLFADGVLCGCVALKKIDDDTCEMKRLYIKPKMRAKKLGYYLVDYIIKEAINIKYKYMVLDTFCFLDKAIDIYKKFGFYEIPQYNNCPIEDTIYLKLDLIKETTINE